MSKACVVGWVKWDGSPAERFALVVELYAPMGFRRDGRRRRRGLISKAEALRLLQADV